ncbi:leucine-rich repeat protein [Alloprevotella tannerae]|uniref:leucine-rich repeat protein n=1 Tax=Alloprevotella tannerae TaxID=76122 RepID=UPI001EDC4879|nr:leucine-rich repeat protein [Alloprevotella tannerae]MCG2648948.1 leucine-rich repeat protein [Alloprevotella tannerae]
MRKSYLFTLLVSVLFCCTLNAQTTKTVDVTQPGTLSAMLGEDLKTVKDLTVTGKINSADIDALMQAGALEALNLLDAAIVDAEGKETTVFPGYTLRKHPSLTTLTFPKTVTSIGAGAFFKCLKLKKVVLPEAIKKLSESVFMSCSALSEINFPNGLESIGRSALYMTAITDFIAPKSLRTLGDNALYGTQITKAVLNDKLEKIGQASFAACKQLEKIEIENNPNFKLVDGVLYSADETTLVAYPLADKRPLYKTLSTVTTICQGIFEGAVNLKDIYINEGVTTIPVSLCCNAEALERMYWPATITDVKVGAIDACKKLRELHVAATKAPAADTGAFGVMFKNYTAYLYVPFGAKASYEANEEWNENFLGIKEESTEPNTIVLKTNRAIGDIFSLKVGAKEGEKIGIKGASYNEQDQLIFTDTEVTLYGKIAKIDCSSNKLTSIVITNQPQLREIYCDDNELTKLEVNYVPVLATLYCGNNKDLADIDLKSMPALADLSCYSNSIKQLDLSQNPKLTSLICRDNLIEGTLDLSKNPKVEQVNCYNNKISEIKLAAESSLRHIEMQRNNIKGESMTEFMKALPVYVAYGTDEWDDYGGLNLQGLYVTETSATYEKNVAFTSDVKIATDKKWPVFALDLDNYGSTAPEPYEGAEPTGIATTATIGEVKVYAVHNTINVEGLAEGETLMLYTAKGMLVDKAMSYKGAAQLAAQGAGIYIVKWANNTVKVVVAAK